MTFVLIQAKYLARSAQLFRWGRRFSRRALARTEPPQEFRNLSRPFFSFHRSAARCYFMQMRRGAGRNWFWQQPPNDSCELDTHIQYIFHAICASAAASNKWLVSTLSPHTQAGIFITTSIVAHTHPGVHALPRVGGAPFAVVLLQCRRGAHNE
jgi:hypothetical protein